MPTGTSSFTCTRPAAPIPRRGSPRVSTASVANRPPISVSNISEFERAGAAPLLFLPNLTAVIVGLALIGVGTFFVQAAATGFVGRPATTDRGGERHLSRLLLLRGPSRQHHPRTGLRPLWLACLRRWHRAFAGDRRPARVSPEVPAATPVA